MEERHLESETPFNSSVFLDTVPWIRVNALMSTQIISSHRRYESTDAFFRCCCLFVTIINQLFLILGLFWPNCSAYTIFIYPIIHRMLIRWTLGFQVRFLSRHI
ncbi:hypothetical protein F4679DRAFT_542992, partial [Xylaria curta]